MTMGGSNFLPYNYVTYSFKLSYWNKSQTNKQGPTKPKWCPGPASVWCLPLGLYVKNKEKRHSTYLFLMKKYCYNNMDEFGLHAVASYSEKCLVEWI